MNELFAILLSWAVTLSGYPPPATPPEVIAVSHSFFVEKACGGRECKVFGWYAGGTKLYVDESIDLRRNNYGASIVVHEMVHYLQGVSRNNGFAATAPAYVELPDCTEIIKMEREAYRVQNEYLIRNGTFMPAGVALARMECKN